MKRNRYVMIIVLMFVMVVQICARQADDKKMKLKK